MNQLYTFVTVAVLLALSLLGACTVGKVEAQHKAELASVTSELNATKDQIKKEREARVADARLAQEAEARATELRAKISNLEEYADALADAGRECLSGADTERLRDLWK